MLKLETWFLNWVVLRTALPCISTTSLRTQSLGRLLTSLIIVYSPHFVLECFYLGLKVVRNKKAIVIKFHLDRWNTLVSSTIDLSACLRFRFLIKSGILKTDLGTIHSPVVGFAVSSALIKLYRISVSIICRKRVFVIMIILRILLNREKVGRSMEVSPDI